MDEKSKKMFLGLYQMILSDTEVHPKELELLYQIGKEKGVSEEDIQKAILSPNNIISSEHLNDDEKIEYLYNLARIAWADGILDENEIKTLQNASKRLGFAEEDVETIAQFLLDHAHENKRFEEVLEIIKNS
ncbi:MAG: hypothetical protein LBP85_06870 [Prevotellaceae bacterium]|jgi:uncharacterized tellurite resistance protein B-like protein|nr:hypothetical protein [Prevotellaceae bacterium]